MTNQLLRELGALAKQRREELGFNKPALAKEAGIESEHSITDLERGQALPPSATLRKLERALEWRLEVIDEIMRNSNRPAGSLRMEELDAEDSIELAARTGLNLVSATDDELMAEVSRRGL